MTLMVNNIYMKISEIPTKDSITSAEISAGYMLGMKNLYPDDEVPVRELQRFPLTAFVSDIGLDTTRQLIERLRNIDKDLVEQKENMSKFVDNIRTITEDDVEKANLNPKSNTVPYQSITAQLLSKFANREELQTAVNNVYSALFAAIEEVMVQILTTSLYARQYTMITDDISASDKFANNE